MDGTRWCRMIHGWCRGWCKVEQDDSRMVMGMMKDGFGMMRNGEGWYRMGQDDSRMVYVRMKDGAGIMIDEVEVMRDCVGMMRNVQTLYRGW